MSKLLKKVVYKGTITLKTGLHIGGTNAALNIGGPDKFVVRNPLNNVPYIPGSSLKGKLRALIEISNGCVSVNRDTTGPSNDPSSLSGELFGVAGDSQTSKPSRLIVRDAEMFTGKEDETELRQYEVKASDIPDLNNTDLPFTESKTEVAIDRVTAKANPRTFERVPAGAIFRLDLVLNIFEGENEDRLKKTLARAIALLEDDYLGGQGSRGYGQVKIHFINEQGEDKIY